MLLSEIRQRTITKKVNFSKSKSKVMSSKEKNSTESRYWGSGVDVGR